MYRRLLLPLIALVLALTTVPHTAIADAGFPSVGRNWGAPGPYATAVDVGAVTTLYYPRDIAQSPRRHPVIIWGNGTFAFPVVYRDLLLHWASHGFIVAAANTPQSNLGISMLAGIDLLASRNANPGSVFHDRVDLSRIGASGHSQGGAAAIVVGADPRVDTILPIQPGPLANVNAVGGPMFALAGQYDSIVWPTLVKALYDDADHIPAIYGEVRGADHFTVVGDPGPFAAPTTAWFRFQLMGDEEARGEFFGSGCRICSDTRTWSDVRRNPLALQVPGTTS
ncbi:pimeloyl-ACP methyl ester carboxylesterase [Streptosporangium album]|uniref:poly(ethylene terephthalate) hydrolase n=1 Tax=Streptosporangium album TaxID=47479 RepID=A0A7W7W8Y9_9ACTN|nr:acetylxylan esterase [Streptosporangium album]MBB4938473.1 pimeloyl-ACP methyl ester carboxylesterase [Streptosporangium album]